METLYQHLTLQVMKLATTFKSAKATISETSTVGVLVFLASRHHGPVRDARSSPHRVSAPESRQESLLESLRVLPLSQRGGAHRPWRWTPRGLYHGEG